MSTDPLKHGSCAADTPTLPLNATPFLLMGWSQPSPTASECAKFVVLAPHKGEAAIHGKVTIIGVNLAKNVIQLHGAAADGSVVFRKKLSRLQFCKFMASQQACVVAMEGCGSSHYWALQMARLGHEPRLIAPAYVIPFVKRQKMGWLPPSPDGIAMCQGRGVQRHKKERTANERYYDRGGPGKERFPASRRDNDGASEIP
ncbi:transposase [Mesorhizobium sp. M8A.F.Ca.ET.165.01.1.1]|uniref:transposase n=1 Tax=Mesorhizobium sp. M8A.F.Ca.ET.165.01.1.1 TaxID=2563960 RepID=UPI0016727E60